MNDNERNPPLPLSVAITAEQSADDAVSRITILVVDDELAVRQVVCAMLLLFGYRAVAAPDGEEALRLIFAADGLKYDILLTDYQMPAMLGDELARRFREACPEAGIIMMSGNLAEAPRIPRCELLPKPFHAEALRTKVRAVLPAHAVN